MIVVVGSRGRSFKGAGQYFLHDKKADTSERVAFTETQNMMTDDAGRGFDTMAYTAMHQHQIKEQAGTSLRGGNCDRPVYHYTLAWAHDDEPAQDHMLDMARETLRAFGFGQHQAVIVGHDDREHLHAHVIVNLVHPDSGKTADIRNDHLKAQSWAERYELQHGIHCEARLINQMRRRQGEYVQHEGRAIDHKAQMQALWQQSDSFQSFQSALEGAGYGVAAGDKRGIVVIDHEGKAHSLSRQLEKDQRVQLIALLREKDILAELSDVETAKEAQEKRRLEQEENQRQLKEEFAEQVIEPEPKPEAETPEAANDNDEGLGVQFEQAHSGPENPQEAGEDQPPLDAAGELKTAQARHMAEMAQFSSQMAAQRKTLHENMELEFGAREREERERVAALQVSLEQARGITGLWRSLTGRTRRETEALEDARLAIEELDHKRDEAFANFEQRRMREHAQLEERQKEERAAYQAMIAQAEANAQQMQADLEHQQTERLDIEQGRGIDQNDEASPSPAPDQSIADEGFDQEPAQENNGPSQGL